jgi:23S rRNA pseudouridine1911/1915/1917 synthase
MTNLRRLLPPPSVLFSTNHLLIINKPPGWSSIPTKSGPDKSVLDYLVAQKLGGGSRGEFLIPLHRIDQPCSGVLLLAKTSKAASRVTQIWKKHEVEKTYLCVVEKPLTSLLRDWNRLEGWIPKGKTKGSVTILREPRDHTRHISLEWRSVHRNRQLVQVRTHMGARHMVRALLSIIWSLHCGGFTIPGAQGSAGSIRGASCAECDTPIVVQAGECTTNLLRSAYAVNVGNLFWNSKHGG